MFRNILIVFIGAFCVACEENTGPLRTIKLLHGSSECLRIDHPSEGPTSLVCSESIGVGDGAVYVCWQKWSERYAINLPCKDYDAIKRSMLPEKK